MNVAFNFSLGFPDPRLNSTATRHWLIWKCVLPGIRGWTLVPHSYFLHFYSFTIEPIKPRDVSLSWLKFCFCANKDNWMCPGHWGGNIQWVCCLTLSILTTFQFPSLVLSALNLKQRDCFADCALGRQHYSIRDKYIAHQICGPVCGISGIRHGAGGGSQCRLSNDVVINILPPNTIIPWHAV